MPPSLILQTWVNPLIFTKHFQHALSHGETTENIDAGYQHGNKGQYGNPSAMADLQQRTNDNYPGYALVTDISGVCNA